MCLYVEEDIIDFFRSDVKFYLLLSLAKYLYSRVLAYAKQWCCLPSQEDLKSPITMPPSLRCPLQSLSLNNTENPDYKVINRYILHNIYVRLSCARFILDAWWWWDSHRSNAEKHWVFMNPSFSRLIFVPTHSQRRHQYMHCHEFWQPMRIRCGSSVESTAESIQHDFDPSWKSMIHAPNQ